MKNLHCFSKSKQSLWNEFTSEGDDYSVIVKRKIKTTKDQRRPTKIKLSLEINGKKTTIHIYKMWNFEIQFNNFFYWPMLHRDPTYLAWQILTYSLGAEGIVSSVAFGVEVAREGPQTRHNASFGWYTVHNRVMTNKTFLPWR